MARTWLIIIFVVLAGPVQTAGCAAGTDPPESRTIRISTGAVGGNFHPLGEMLADTFGSRLRNLRVDVLAGGGAVGNLGLLARGEADLAFTFADVAYAAYVGPFGEANEPLSELRAIVLLRPSALHLVASTASIHQVADLHDRSALFGSTATSLAARRVLEVFGLEPDRIQASPSDRGLDAFEAGRVDAMFMLSRYPATIVQRAADRGARLVPIAGEPIERLLDEYPFYVHTIIPAGVYGDEQPPLETIGVSGLLACREGLDEQVAYDLTRALFEELDELPPTGSLLEWFDTDRAEAAPIPLHPGAARYYRERGLFR
jgi:TRAP transporter TAXI family solute receptor